MTKSIKRILIAFAIILFLLLTFYTLNRLGVLDFTGSNGIKLYEYSPNDLRNVSIENSKLGFNYNVKIDYPNFYIEGLEDKRYDAQAVSNFLQSVSSLYAYSSLGKTEDFHQYGLDNPQLVVDINLSDGKNYHVTVGDMMPNNNSYYVKISDKDDIYTVKKEYLNIYFEYEYYTLSKQINILKDADSEIMVDNFSITKNKSPFFTFRAFTEEDKKTINSSNLFYITFPFNAIGSDSSLISYINSVTTLKCARILTGTVNDKTLLEAGLINPCYEITFDYYGNHYVIYISEPSNGLSNLYIKGDNIIYSFYAQDLGLIDFNYFNYVNSNQFSRDISTVDSVTISYGESVNKYDITWKNSTTIEKVVLNNTKSLSSDGFKNLYSVLNSSRVEGLIEELPDNIQPSLTIKYDYNSTAKFKSETVVFYKINERQYALEVNNNCTFYVPSMYIDKLIESMNLFNDNKEFDPKW